MSPDMKVDACKSRRSAAARLLARRFRREEDGSLVIFSLYVLLCMMLAVGMAVDTIRTEYARAKLQNVVDAAVLSAANPGQTLPARDVVEDYLSRAGIDPDKVVIETSTGTQSRSASASARFDMPTIFMDMVGVNNLSVPVAGRAEQSSSELEIALVLDNSGSMGFNGNRRMDLLKVAAKDFIDQVLANPDAQGEVAISLIPFATQVSAGPDILDQYDVSDEHSSSHCVDFDAKDFNSASMPNRGTLGRTAHFTISNSMPPGEGWICPTDESRHITPWSGDAEQLKAKIEAMVAAGNTSIELGAKWGLAMLDPGATDVLETLVEAGQVDEKFRGQPFDYGTRNEDGVSRMKYLIIMSDGANTSQPYIKSRYRDGPSTLFVHEGNFSYHDPKRPASEQYYRFNQRSWHATPDGDGDAARLTWPEVWETMGVFYYITKFHVPATGEKWSDESSRILGNINNQTKNARTSQVCREAKDAGIIVFTIGMDTYGDGDATLSDCASGEGYFYDVEGDDLGQAFSSIARTINHLRLTN